MVSPNLNYRYNQNAQRYIDSSGRFVSESTVNSAIEEHIEDGFEQLDALLAAALDPSTPYDLDEFYEAMRLQLKVLHVQVGVIGAGGINNADSATYGRIGQILRSEYAYARGYVDAIANGQLTEVEARRRLGMYANKIWGSYSSTRRIEAGNAGFTQERRVLSPQADSCRDCVRFAAMGWQPIGTLPAPTEESECMSNCRCRMEFRS